MLQQYLGMVATPVPFFTPNVDFVMDATALSKLAGERPFINRSNSRKSIVQLSFHQLNVLSNIQKPNTFC